MSWVTGAFHDSPMTVNAFLEAAMAILTSLVVSLLLLL